MNTLSNDDKHIIEYDDEANATEITDFSIK